MPANTPVIKGLTTISWGTIGQLGTPSAAIVESIDVTPKNSGPITEVENGDGAGVNAVLLDDGFDAKVSCVYDSALTWPVVGASVNLTLPKLGAVGGTQVFACYVVSYAPNTKRKKEAMVNLNLLYRPGF